ncbi:hypothetical protein ACMFMF_003938 [Clarireedia jacksonii]
MRGQESCVCVSGILCLYLIGSCRGWEGNAPGCYLTCISCSGVHARVVCANAGDGIGDAAGGGVGYAGSGCGVRGGGWEGEGSRSEEGEKGEKQSSCGLELHFEELRWGVAGRLVW